MIRWAAPGPYEVVFSTRVGGVSDGPYASLNLGRKSGDEVERVDENRRIACEAIGADVARLALNFQVHSARVREAEPATRGERADGLWTDEAGLPILAMSADCLPIAIARAEGSRPAVAVLHAGWRGLLEGIVASGVEARIGLEGLVDALDHRISDHDEQQHDGRRDQHEGKPPFAGLDLVALDGRR